MRGIASTFIAVLCLCALCAGTAAAQEPGNGGTAYGEPDQPAPTPPPSPTARSSTASPYAPESAPQPVKDAIAAANSIVGKPYVYGGGHNTSFKGRGYDCSGTVSFALHGGDLLKSPLDSGSFMRWGSAGAGDWITVYRTPATPSPSSRACAWTRAPPAIPAGPRARAGARTCAPPAATARGTRRASRARAACFPPYRGKRCASIRRGRAELRIEESVCACVTADVHASSMPRPTRRERRRTLPGAATRASSTHMGEKARLVAQ